MAKFTAKFIEAVKPGPVRRELPDPGCSNLYLVIQPITGARSWALRCRVNGKSIKLTLGSWPAVSLHDARAAATAALKQVKLGNDPAKARQDAKIKADAAKADTVTAICESYLRREGSKLRTVDQRVSILKRQVYPVLGGRPIGEIKRSEIVHLLDRVEDRSGPRAADVTLAVLRRIFHWHEKRSDEFRSPIIRGMARQNAKDRRRTRILDDDELRRLWTATADGTVFSALIRVLLLSGARRNEIARMKWGEIDAGGIWTLPAARSKSAAEIIRPLSGAALALIAQMPRIDGCPFVFVSATGRTPISQFWTPKRRLDKASGVANWRLHDLRRTARSLLSRAGVNVDTAERCLGHALPAIRATYDRHQYIGEMRHAFEVLATLIESITNPQDNVLPLRR